MKEIEQSKIYVDVDSIKRTVDEDLRETYARYMALRQSRVEVIEPEKIRNAVKNVTAGNILEIVRLELPQSEISEVFESIVTKIRDEYVMSPEHGLDKYLSVRIRHGTLAAHLRRPLENAKIVTTRDSSSGEYKWNDYWDQRLSNEPSIVRETAIARLSTFSREYDKFIGDVKSWIQVKKDSSGPGLFDFTLESNSIRVISEALPEGTSFMDCVELLLNGFSQTLDLNLERVRDQIANLAKTEGRTLLESLARDIERFASSSPCRELLNAIRTATTEQQVAIDRMSTWFRRAHGTGDDPFTLQEAVDVSAEWVVRTVYSGFTVSVQSDQDTNLSGTLLPTFVDILFIIFENIARHSHSLATPSAEITLMVTENNIQILVENRIDSALIDEISYQKVNEIKSSIQDEKNATMVRREGGTGFHKLARILSHDLEVEPNLDFGFRGDKFFVIVNIPMKWIEQ
jgi:hypothetical protein